MHLNPLDPLFSKRFAKALDMNILPCISEKLTLISIYIFNHFKIGFTPRNADNSKVLMPAARPLDLFE